MPYRFTLRCALRQCGARPASFFALFVLTLLILSLLVPLPAHAAGAKGDATSHVSGTYTGSNPLGSVTFAFDQQSDYQFSQGTALGQADKVYAASNTLAASATANLDLAGSLLDPFGAVVTFAHVNVIRVEASASNVNDVCFGGAASNGFLGQFADPTDVTCVKPGGVLLLVNPGVGWVVTAGTGDLLKTANSGGTTSVTYKILIIGKST
jgi:hypothetical protein